MKLNYEELLSGDLIYIDGVGHVKSPKLKELNPTSGIGMWKYNLYLNILSWDKEEFLRFIRAAGHRSFRALDDPRVEVFNAMTLFKDTRELLQNAMAFFINEKLEWDSEKKNYVITNDAGADIGIISRNNFEEVRDALLQLNYINVNKKEEQIKHSSKKSEELWKIVQKNLKEQAKKEPQNDDLRFGNVISKLCSVGIGYTLLNVYDLTVFQLYDQFFQYGYLRAMDLNERAFTIHGGDKFNMQDWLKPIFKK